MNIKIFISSSIALFTCFACNNQFSHPDTSNIAVNIKVIPFYQDVFSKTDSSISCKINRLDSIYPMFFSDFCAYDLHIGRPSDSLFAHNFNMFLSAPENDEVISCCDSVYYSMINLNNDISDAFSCIKYYCPRLLTPIVSCHFSGFGNKIIVDSTYISFSIEHYLGSDCRFYSWLDIPVYARYNKTRDNIVPDLVKAWLYANFPDTTYKDDILTAMIYQGKILYATHKVIPNISDNLLFGFNDSQLKWCNRAESEMWAYLAENKLLYSTEPLDKNKLINEAPFTSYFGTNSPGRATLFCAYHIVCNYMSRYPETTLEQLFCLSDAQQLLVEARYRP